MAGILRTIRLERGLTQQELGEMAGLNQVTISTWERGTRAGRVGNLRRLAKALGVELHVLMEDEDPGNQP
jgi:transcriptional regulator with XRE-family HTH domain